MKIGILGTWHVHAQDYAKLTLQHGELIGFFEREESLAQSFLDSMGVDIPRFKTRDELLSGNIDAVIVCSATEDHPGDIIAAARAKKHIFTEKVLALTPEDCKRIADAIHENGVKFTISFPHKYSATSRAIKGVCDSGELGKINYVRFRNCHSGSLYDWLPSHFYSRKQCGGGAMIDLGAHGMYLIDWILGMPSAASSTFTVADDNPKNVDRVEDNAVTVMKYPSGAIAVNETGFVSGQSPIQFEVYGEHGYVRAENDSVEKCTNATNGKIVSVALDAPLPLPIVQFLKGNAPEGCGIEEAKRLTQMMALAYATKA